MEIILSTRNPSKIGQIRAIFHDPDIKILSLDDAGIAGEAIEDGSTLEENATKKALFASQLAKKWAMADDTGIFIDALNGAPGIHSARWAGKNASTEDILNFVLDKLKGMPEAKRTATFMTVAVIVSPNGEKKVFTGSVRGSILTKPQAKYQPKMPYSGIFLPDGQGKVWAEMSPEEENVISHRGQAFRKMHNFLAEVIKINQGTV
jgi:XTP/dITP diphosphohydrolase